MKNQSIPSHKQRNMLTTKEKEPDKKNQKKEICLKVEREAKKEHKTTKSRNNLEHTQKVQ